MQRDGHRHGLQRWRIQQPDYRYLKVHSLCRRLLRQRGVRQHVSPLHVVRLWFIQLPVHGHQQVCRVLGWQVRHVDHSGHLPQLCGGYLQQPHHRHGDVHLVHSWRVRLSICCQHLCSVHFLLYGRIQRPYEWHKILHQLRCG